MARGFSLTAEINLRGPTNIRPIVDNLRRQLGSINANVNVNINRATIATVGQLNTNLNRLNATLASTTQSANSAAQAFGNLAAAMRSVGSVNLPSTIQAPVVRLTSSANAARTAIAETRTEFEDFGRQAGLAVRRFAAFSSVTSVVYSFTNALSAGVKQYVEFDKQITRLSQVTNESKANLSGVVGEITRLSTSLGVASEDLAQVSVTLAQAGFSAADTRKALEALARSALAPSFDDLNQTVEGSIALMRQFGISANQLEGALGSINSVAAAFAVEASDLITAIQRTGGVFAAASNGVSTGTDALNEFLAVFTSVRATTRESAETIATGLRTIFTRIQRGDTIEALKEYGVQLTDLEGKFVGPYIAVQRLAEGLGRLDPRDLKFSQIVEELGGFRQIGKVLPLIQQFATAQDALKIAQQGQGSLATDAAKGQQALAVQIQKVREEFTALVRSVGESQGFQLMVRLGLDLASALIKVADATKGVLPLIGIMAAFRGVSAIAQFAGGFGSGLRGGQNRRANQGGRIYGFASGGLVPGSGNRDTVPAMLTPGEFVVRKSAVKAVGANKLQNVNKYANGGKAVSQAFTVQELEKTGGPKTIIDFYQKKKAVEPDDKIYGKINKIEKDLGPRDFREIIKRSEKIANQSSRGQSSYKELKLSPENKQNYLDVYFGKGPDKKKRNRQASLWKSAEKRWGSAFEDYIVDHSDDALQSIAGGSFPVDIKRKRGSAVGEAKFRSVEEMPEVLISKLFRYKIKSSEQKLLSQFKEAKKNEIDDVNVGSIDYFWAGKSKEKFYQYLFDNPDIYQKMAVGGVAKARKPKEVFGTGETVFPARIRKKYAEEKQTADDNLKAKMAWDQYPQAERISVDESKVQEAFQQPFDQAKFIESFKQKISRNTLFSRMADFAKFIGLPQENLSAALPLQLDFGGPGISSFVAAQFSKGATGSRIYEGYDLSRFGYGEPQKQEAYGLEKLIETKKKEIAKIIKTPARTFDDGSFGIDNEAFSKADEELRALQAKAAKLRDLKYQAQKTILAEQNDVASSSGRGTVSFGPSLGYQSTTQNNLMYHELTHQLFEGLRARSQESFDKYKARVVSLFTGDNDDLADAFDALTAGRGYSSADVVYGRSYKSRHLTEMLTSYYRQNSLSDIDRIKEPVPEDITTNLASLNTQSETAKRAREYRPINPKVNQALLTGKYAMSQDIIDKMEDNGKEEFLTTLVQNAPELDQNLQGILNSTLTELLGGAGIKRQRYLSGGRVQRFVDGGWVERMKQQPDDILRRELEMLHSGSFLLSTGERKVLASTFSGLGAFEDIGKRELVARMQVIKDYLDERAINQKAKYARRRGPGLQATEQYDEQEMLDAVNYYAAGSGPFTRALVAGAKTFKEPRGETYKTKDIKDRLLAASQFTIPKKTYSGLGRSQFKEILNDTNTTPRKLATKTDESLRSLVGQTIDFPTFLSVSAQKDQAEAFVQNPGALLSIDGSSTSQKTIDVVKARRKTQINDSALKSSRRLKGVENISEKKLDIYEEEQEFIIPPNVGFKITKATGMVYRDLSAKDLKSKSKKALFDDLDMFSDPDIDDFDKTRLDLKVGMLRSGGMVQKFMDGGVAQRKLGYIDYDVIANPDNEAAVKKGMEETGVTGPRLYTDHLTQLAVQARKNSNLQKLRAVYGVAGSGKTTLARGQGTDSAKLRQTERFPILTPEDIQRATEVIVLSSSVSKDKLDNIFDATDRTYTLSSTTKEEKDRVKSQRGIRDTTGVGLEGRKPGSTASVSTDTAVGEALLADRLGDRSVVLGRSESGRLRRKSGNELVEVIKKKIGFTWGGYSPMTAGHESIMDAASAMGISPEDFIYLVGSNEGIIPGKEETYRTAIFDQDTRVLLAKAGAGARGATVLPKPRDFEVPQAFDLSEEGQRRRVLIPAKGSSTFVADKTPQGTEKYKLAGYDVKHIERTGGISGTMVRQLIKDGNLGELQKVLSPGVYDLISNNIGRIQNRANILPSIIEEVQQTQGVKLADVEKQIKAIGISRIDNKKVATDPEYAAKVEVLRELREKRDSIKSSASFEPHRLLAALAAKEPDRYGLDLSGSMQPSVKSMRTFSAKSQKVNLGGMIQSFNDGGAATALVLGKSVADTATQNNISKQQAILEHLAAFKGISGVRAAARIPSGERRIGSVLRKNNIEQGNDLAEAEQYINRALSARAGAEAARKKDIKRSQKLGLLFGAAGVLGNTFSPIKKKVGAGELTEPVDVYVTSGTLDPQVSLRFESILNTDIDKTTRRAAKRVMVDQIMAQAGLGKILQLDFDKTLAFGADKIVSDDPKASQFSAFSDPQKIQEGLGNARLSLLGKELVKLVVQKPELISNMRVVTARPQNTLDMVQSWLSARGLPIPLSQFTGVGGTSVSGSQIAKLKAAVLESDSVFVDDNRKNIKEARKARKGITTYRYGLNSVKPDANREGTTKGNMFERVIEALGGPKADKAMKGIDFPTGLKAAGKYFGIRGDIPTDAKRTLSGPSTVEANIVSYLKANGYKQGGKVDYYSLEKSSGLSSREFDGIVQYAKTNDFSLDEFRSYLSKRAVEKQNKVGSVIDPKSLQSFLMHGATGARLGTGDLTEQQKQLAEMLKSDRPDPQYNPDYDRRNLGGLIQGFANGGSVPALVSNGEAYVPPKLAKKIGYGKLNRMNQADRNGMGRFSEGGISVFKGPGTGTSDSISTSLPVGSFILREKATKALGFNRGGSVGVQRFFFGGRTRRGPEARPDIISPDTIGAAALATNALNQLAEVLADLGVSGSASARLLSRGYQATAAEAARAAQSDLNMARAAGAGADVLFDLERAVQRATEAQDRQLALMQQLGDISGDVIQDAIEVAEEQIRNLRQAAEEDLRRPGTRTDDEVETELRAGEADRRRAAYATAAGTVGVDLGAIANATGDDLASVLQNISRDSRTLEQMNARLLQNRRRELTNTVEFTSASAAEQRRMLSEVERLANEEIRVRRIAIEDAARSRGERGPNEQETFDRQANMALSFGVITVGNIIADTINAKSSLGAAAVSGAVRGGSQAYSYTNAVVGEMENLANNMRRSGSSLAQFATRAARAARGLQVFAVFGQAMIDAYNSARNFTIELEKNNIEKSLAGLSDNFDKLNRDLTQLNLRNNIQNNLINASKSAEKLRQKTLDTASAGWINGLDVFFSYIDQQMTGGDGNRRAAVRSQVLEQEGIGEYLKTIVPFLGGGPNIYEDKAAKLSQTQGAESSKSFQPIAEGINQLIQARVKSGENITDLLNGPEFKEFARTLVYADTALNQQIRQIELTTSLTEEQKRKRIEEIISIEGANKLRTQAAIAQREKDQRNLDATASVYTRSLKRMFTNMEQAINSVSYSLKTMADEVDLAAAAVQGQAKVGNVDLSASSIIRNPRAYNEGQVTAAQNMAGSLFGNRSAEMSQLMNLGEIVEGTVMSTINSTLATQGPSASNETIARAVDKSVRDKLSGLGLPPELADKLAREVGNTLADLRKSGDEKIDFASLSEKIANLGKVIETARDAQEIAIKALENYQNILNQYANNINRIIDLEIGARDKSRKAIDITADSQLSLSKSLNKTIKIADIFAKRDASVSRQTGGITSATNIFTNIGKLLQDRQIQQSSAKQASDSGLAGTQDFIKFNNELKNTNIALRENRAALEEMANNTEKASAAMDAIQEAQQKAAGRVGLLEKVVTSTPDELESLGQALYRLQRNINGQQNTIQNSIGAQKAYQEAINNGASAFEAMRAAQTAFANERKDTLGALQDIMPFLGDNQQSNNIKANVLETMLQESGMGVSPLFQQVLNTLRNPEADPATAAAIQYYNQAIGEQANATRLLGQLDQNLADDIAMKNSKMLIDQLNTTILTFQSSQLRDINSGINTMVSIMKNAPVPGAPAPAAPAPGGFAVGGLVYAAAGQLVDFQPRGSDTVPAMLTPGEFVVNRAATQKNLPLLKQINSNSMSNGGKVSYYAAGGLVTNWGDPTNIKSYGLETQKEIINIGQTNINDYWSKGTGKIYNLPKFYTLQFNSGGGALPDGENGNLNAGNIIDPSRGTVVLGAMPTIRHTYSSLTGSQYSYEAPGGNAVNLLQGGLSMIKDNNTAYFGLEPFDSKKVKQIEAEEYKNNLIAKLPGIDGGLLPEIIIDKNQYRSEMPKTSEFAAGLSANTWKPNLIDKSFGLSFGNNSIGGASVSTIDTAPAYKIWFINRSLANPIGWLPGMAMAVSTSSPVFGAGSPYANTSGWTTYEGGTKASVAALPDNAPNIVLGSKINDANQRHKTNYELYKNTKDFIDGRLSFDDTGKGQGLQDKLSSLMNGQSYVELSESEISPLDGLLLQNAKTALIAQKSLENSFIAAIESAAVNNKKNIKFGLTGAFPAGREDFDLGEPFEIEDAAAPAPKQFPFMINGTISDLGESFQEQAKQEAAKTKGIVSSRSVIDKLKIKIPVNLNGQNPDLEIPVAYKEYDGFFYDVTKNAFDQARPIKTYLPNTMPSTLFEKLDISQRRLFTDKQYSSNELLAASTLADPNVIQDLESYFAMKANNDPNMVAQADKVKAGLSLNFPPKSSYLKYLGGTAGAEDVFADISNAPTSINIGDIILKQLSNFQQQLSLAAGKVDQSGMIKGDKLDNVELPQAAASLIRGSMALFGNLRLPGVPNNWLQNAGATQAIRLALMGNPQGSAQYMSGVFNEAGKYVSLLQNRATSISAYNSLDNIMTMISGAAGAFGSIAGGDTGLLKQFYEAKVSIADVFRSFGIGARGAKVGSMELSPDWKNLLGNQLQGTQIKIVGRDGVLTPTNLAGAIPENASVNDLIKVLFNPYNEFPDTTTRSSLIQKFGDDLFNLRGPRGARYFDPQSLAFIRDGLFRLMDWYGGKDKWVGQDYLFDTKAEPDNAVRSQTLNDSFINDGTDFYKKAREAHMLFGFANAFGDLPSNNWFNARAAVEPVRKASGGMIYAAGGGDVVNFQPKGTDTVPAMLTPGEFVINRSATQKNLPLLKAINSGVSPYSEGGVVYLSDGGLLGEQKANIDAKIASKIAEMNQRQKFIDEQKNSWFGSTRNWLIGGSTPDQNAQNLDRIALIQLQRVRSAIDDAMNDIPTEGMDDNARKLFINQYASVITKAEQAQRELTIRKGAQEDFDAEYQAIDATKQTIETALAVVGSVASVASSGASVFGNLGLVGTSAVSGVTAAAEAGASTAADGGGIRDIVGNSLIAGTIGTLIPAGGAVVGSAFSALGKFGRRARRMIRGSNIDDVGADAATTASKAADDAAKATDDVDATKLPKEQKTLVKQKLASFKAIEEKLASFKTTLQESQANRITAYVDNIEQEVAFRMQSIDNMISNNQSIQKAYKKAIDDGVTDPDVLSNILYKPYRTDVNRFADDLRMKGWDVDLGPPLTARRNDDVIKNIIDKDTEDALTQTRVRAIQDAEQGLSEEGRAVFRQAIDDPNIRFENRSWSDWLKSKRDSILQTKRKYITAPLGLGTTVTIVNSQKVKPITDPKPEMAPIRVADGTPDGGGEGDTGGNEVDKAPRAVAPPPPQQAGPVSSMPDYYDELTYKEYASRAIVAGQAPPAPMQEKFTTAAFYTREGRNTAYDQRSSRVDRIAGLTAKDAIGGRDIASQTHTTTAAFTSAGIPRDITSSQPEMPPLESDNNALAPISQIAQAPTDQTFEPTGKFGEQANNRATYKAATASAKLTGAKSASSQYKSAYMWWRYRLGEYNYYNTKNDKIRERWMKGFGKYDRLQKAQQNEAQASTELPDTVYAAQGTLVPYQPKGTDTVPAMLTPGEFVVNRKATQQNLSLLKSINSGNYSTGGKVAYLSAGSGRLRLEDRREIVRKKKEDEEKRLKAIKDRREELARSIQSQRDDQINKAQQSKTQVIEARKRAMALAKEQGISQQEAMTRVTNVENNAPDNAPRAAQAQQPAMAQIPQISPQMQQRVGQAAQAAFNPENAGNINKQLAIFGTLLTGVNQTITQFGAIMQQIVGIGGVNNEGKGGNAKLDGLGQFTAKFDQFITQLSKLNLPPEININGKHRVEVIINGAEALKEILEGPLGNIVRGEIANAFEKIRVETEGAVPGPSSSP